MTPMTVAAPQTLTIPALLAATVAARSEEPALGVIEGGQLRWLSWRQLADKVDAWAAHLASRGIQPGDRVAQLSPNCQGWIVADLALQAIGAVHVPLHVSLASSQIDEQITHSGAKLLIVSSSDLADDRIRFKLPPACSLALHSEMHSVSPAGNPLTPHTPAPDDLATILYTSGTTGPPRGVMLTQRNIAANAVAMADELDTGAIETRLLLLPLSHIYARTCDLYCWIYRGSRLVIAESRETALRDCKLAEPTVVNAVPYFYQKVTDGLRSGGVHVDTSTLKAALGGAVKMLFCGGAALPAEVERFFEERGLPVMCGYGLTEASPVITATTPATYSPGSVGRPLPNVEVRLAADGEVQVRGPSVMQGYWQNDAETARAIEDGWLHTGDLGQWDAKGNLRIVGRKKEMIVLATGKKVAPTHIEQLLLGSPWIEQCCVLGDGRKCLAALIVPNPDALRAEIRRQRLWVWSRRRALSHPKVLAHYRGEIDRCLGDAAEFEQVGAFTLIGRGFSIEHGELTPKLSLCRKVIERSFAGEIEAIYRRPPGPRTARLARK
jgi:long-chain acyl-CoA synthetase